MYIEKRVKPNCVECEYTFQKQNQVCCHSLIVSLYLIMHTGIDKLYTLLLNLNFVIILGNLWHELWETAKAVPAVKQTPLFDEDLAV